MNDIITVKNRVVKLNTTNINDIRDIIKPSYARLLRGQANCNWKLDCSYFRHKKCKYIACKTLFGKCWTNNDESVLKTTFPNTLSNESLHYFPQLSMLAQLQHNGTPTPLLDVSYDMYMPLFCACEDTHVDGKLFLIERTDYCGNTDELDNSELTVLTNEIIPTYNNRIKRQCGAFIKTLVVMNGNLCFSDISKASNKIVTEYIVPAENKTIILNELKRTLCCDDLHTYFYGN